MNGVKKEKKNLACNFSTFAWETHIVYACFFFCDTTTVTRATSSMVQVSHKICNVTFLTVEGKKKLSLLLLPSLQPFKDGSKTVNHRASFTQPPPLSLPLKNVPCCISCNLLLVLIQTESKIM